MEDTLIVAVCGYPELDDTTSYEYLNRSTKDAAWRAVSEDVGLSCEFLLSVYVFDLSYFWYFTMNRSPTCVFHVSGVMPEKVERTQGHVPERNHKTRSGSGADGHKKWKYSAVLSFLHPFITPRETSGKMGRRVEEDETAEYEAGPV